jgi:hypothetical protein
MIYKLAALAAATVISAALIAVPAQARFGGFGGMRSGGFSRRLPWGSRLCRAIGLYRTPGVRQSRSPPHRQFAFFPHRRFLAPFFGIGALYTAGYSSPDQTLSSGRPCDFGSTSAPTIPQTLQDAGSRAAAPAASANRPLLFQLQSSCCIAANRRWGP